MYFALRNRAWTDSNGGRSTVDDSRGVVDIDSDFDVPCDCGLSRQRAREALDDLVNADLVHRVSLRDGHTAQYFVEPLDALTAMTVILGHA
jgi:hypothetical protein